MKEILIVRQDEDGTLSYNIDEQVSVLVIKEIISTLTLKVDEYNSFINTKTLETIHALQQSNNLILRKLDKLTDGISTSLEGLTLILKKANIQEPEVKEI